MADSIRLLCVDDDADFLEVAAEFLSRQDEGFEVETETSVEAGLDRLAAAEFDCVVSDYRMPGRDGLAFLEAVRDRHPDLPFVLFTGQGSEAVASEAMAKGATDYLQKGTGADQFRRLAERVVGAVERHRARRQRKQYRTLVESVGDAMYVLDEDGVVTLANEAMAAMLDTQREEVVGTHASEFMAEGDFERGTDLIREILDDPDRDGGTFEMTVVTTAGRTIPAEINVAPITTGGDGYEATVGVVRDISGRKRRVDSLRTLHETTRELIGAEDVDEAVARALEAAEQVLDVDAIAYFEVDDDSGGLVPVAASEVGGGTDADAVSGPFDPDSGARRWILVPANGQGVLVAGSEGVDEFDETAEELAGILASNLGRAIDSLRREERLRERERELERYETIVEVMGDGVYALDDEGRYTYVNNHFESVTGYEREEVLGESPTAVLPDLPVEEFEEGIRSMVAGEREQFTAEIEIEPAEGEPYPAEVNVAPIMVDGDFQGTVGVVRDVTDMKEREERLELYETAVESTMDGIAVMDEDGEYLLVNQVFAETVGMSPEDFEDPSTEVEFGDYVIDAPDDVLERHREAYETAQEEGTSQFRFETVVDAVEGEVTIENLVTATRRDDGSVIFVSSTRDVTERRERERELERQNERLDAFASVVSHDLRTPLSLASGRLELAKTECDSEHLETVEEAVERMDALIDETLAMARQGRTVSETETVDLGEMVPACWEAVDGEGGTLEADDLPTIRADRERLRQVVENLFRNAIEHGSTDDDEPVTIRVTATEDGFAVSDDGPGIPQSERDDVLSPGYTTAEDGTGFGLTIVSEIADAHGWEIDVGESESGGARFEIRGVEFAD